jgi:hypothetical protein
MNPTTYIQPQSTNININYRVQKFSKPFVHTCNIPQAFQAGIECRGFSKSDENLNGCNYCACAWAL